MLYRMLIAKYVLLRRTFLYLDAKASLAITTREAECMHISFFYSQQPCDHVVRYTVTSLRAAIAP